MTTRRQSRITAAPPAVPPSEPDPPPPILDAWDDDDTDPLLDHVLRILFPVQNMFERVRESLRDSGYVKFEHLYTLDKESLLELTYPDPDSPDGRGRKPLPVGNRNHLLSIMQYKLWFDAKYDVAMDDDDWEAFSAADLKAFRASTGPLSAQLGLPPPVNATTTAKTSGSTTSRVDAFKKTIKRDPNSFQTFSDKRKWATWKLHFVATATAQDLQDVLDPDYVPDNPEDVAIFKLKNHFLYSVFVDKLLTDEGKTYVRLHCRDFDAQTIYAKMCAHYTVSRAAELSTSHVLKFLTTFQLGKDKWKGKTTVNFLAYYVEQLRIYDELSFNRVPPVPPLADDFKLVHLDAAVQSIPDLRQVRITQSTLCQQLGKHPSFNEYLTLLESAATVYDAQQQTAGLRTGDDTRHVYMAQSSDYFTDLSDDPGVWDPGFDVDTSLDNESFDVDVPLSTVTAFAAQQRPPRGPRPPPRDPATNLPSHLYGQLMPADKSAWSRLSNEGRKLIVSNLSPSGDTHGVGGLTSVDRRVHHTSWYDPTPSSTSVVTSSPAPVPANDTQLLAMITNQAHHPGDLRRLLSASAAASPAPSPAATAVVNRHVHSAVAPPIGEDFEGPDGHRYRRINMSKVTRAPNNTYNVANARAIKKNTGALIDRGANGGLAGSDCRIISRSPDRFVNIEGIDRHQLTNIPIVTCGAYTVSRNSGPVILIFHQFAGMMRGPTIISSGQLEAHMNRVNDRSRKIDDNGQLITTNDGFEFPLHIRNGLPYLDLRPYTDKEWDKYPHVIMTSDVDWDPSTIDGEFPLTGDEEFFDASAYDNGTNFDATGRYRLGTIVASARVTIDDPILSESILPDSLLVEQDFDRYLFIDDEDDGKLPAQTHEDPPPPAEPPPTINMDVSPQNNITVPDDPPMVFKNISPHTAKAEQDPEALRPFFAFLPANIVERTLKSTTQYARVPIPGSKRT